MYEFLDRRYALALYNTCIESGNVEIVLEQLEEVVNELNTNEGIIKILKNPQINKNNKKRIFKELFEKYIDKDLLNFLLLLIEKNRILHLQEKYDQFKEIYLKNRNTVTAKVTSAIPLTDEEKETLKSNLETKYRKNIIIEEYIDHSLLGGVMINIGDEVIDGTIKSRLSEIRDLSEGKRVRRYEVPKSRPIEKDKFVTLRDKEEKLDADVTTSVPLTEEDRKNIIDGLKKFYDRDIIIHEKVDKSILDGILVKIGDDVIDGTIKAKLRGVKRHIYNML